MENEKIQTKISDFLVNELIPQFDARVNSVTTSQNELLMEIERLNAELQMFSASIDTPPLEQCVEKLSKARSRILAVNTRLSIIHSRLLNYTSSTAASTTNNYK